MLDMSKLIVNDEIIRGNANAICVILGNVKNFLKILGNARNACVV